MTEIQKNNVETKTSPTSHPEINIQNENFKSLMKNINERFTKLQDANPEKTELSNMIVKMKNLNNFVKNDDKQSSVFFNLNILFRYKISPNKSVGGTMKNEINQTIDDLKQYQEQGYIDQPTVRYFENINNSLKISNTPSSTPTSTPSSTPTNFLAHKVNEQVAKIRNK